MTYGSNITNFSTSRAAAVVVDAVLNSTTFASRQLYMGKPFAVAGRGEMPTLKKGIKVSRRSQFQWVSGLENLNSSAENVTIQMEFNQALGSMPVVDILAESFAREGAGEDVNFSSFNYEDALDETVQELSTAMYADGSGKMPNGLAQIVDDGTSYDTIGGQSRATYSSLKATKTASSGTMSLSKLATLYSTISDTGKKELPTVAVTTWDIFDLYEQLLTPTVRHQYKVLPVGSMYAQNSDSGVGTGGLKMGQGFTAQTYRGVPIIPDKAATSGSLFMLNENYLNWHGRTRVPREYKDFLKPVRLGKAVKEGQAAEKPSKFHGFFYQEKQMMPNQGGIISRFWVVGQLVSFQPRRHGKLTGITSVA